MCAPQRLRRDAKDWECAEVGRFLRGTLIIPQMDPMSEKHEWANATWNA